MLFEGVCSKLTSSWPPAREVGLGTAAPAPLWADPRVAADCRGLPWMNSARLFFMRRRMQIDTFARNWASNFRQIWENRPVHPKAPQGTPKGPPRDPQGSPKGARGTPKGPHGSPRGARAAQREPSVRPSQAKGTPKPVQGQPKQAKRTNYISKNSRSTACAEN